MKTIRTCLSLLTFFLFAASITPAQSPAEESFKQVKTLIGSWNGKTSDGKPFQVSFRSTSAGSVLLSEIHRGGAISDDMNSIFHLDGDRLMLTHYCSAGNQPRMVASISADRKTIAFDFLDATNLAGSDVGHMQRVVIAILEANHHTETWIFTDHDKEMKQVYDLRRAIARK
jgi:hypothetical protein